MQPPNPITLPLTNQEINLLLGALNAADVRGLDSMQAVLALAAKLQASLNPPKEQ